MLEDIRNIFTASEYCKVALIGDSISRVERAISESLNRFGIGNEFEIVRGDSSALIPDWRMERNFDILSAKVRVDGGIHKNTIFYCNMNDCWQSLVANISKHINCSALLIVSSPIDGDDTQFSQQFFKFQNGNLERFVQAYYDEKMMFWQEGTPIHGEDVERYKAARKKQRLDRDYIFHVASKVLEIEDLAVPTERFVEWRRHDVQCA